MTAAPAPEPLLAQLAPTPTRTLPQRALTILLVAPSLDAGSADYGAVGLARMLSGAGHRPIVAAQGGRLESRLGEAKFIRLNTASNNPASIVRNMFALAHLLRSERCDMVHALGRAAAWSAYAAARVARVPFVTSWHKGFREQNALKRLYNSVMVRGECVIATSDQIAELIHERYRLPFSRIVIASPGIDPQSFDRTKVSQARVDAVRRVWGVGEEVKVLLVVGRMLRRKGHHLVVRAAHRMRERGFKDFICVFIGEDQGRTRYTEELWDLIQATGTAEIVRFAERGADLPALYAAADIAVSAAVQPEGLQRSLLEAQAMMLPLVVSDLAAGPELVLSPPAVPDERMTGLRVPAGDDSALAAALMRMFLIPAPARRAMGERGRAWVIANFSDEVATEQMLAAYASIACGRGDKAAWAGH